MKDNNSIDRDLVKAVLAINSFEHTIKDVVEHLAVFSKAVLSADLPEPAGSYKSALKEAGETMAAAMNQYRAIVGALGRALLEEPEEKEIAEPGITLPVTH